MSIHNIGFYEDLTKFVFQLLSNIINYASYLFFCKPVLISFFFVSASLMKFSFRKATQFLYHTFKNEGFMALYRGNSATMARIVPYAAVQYMSHEQYKLMLLKRFNKKK